MQDDIRRKSFEAGAEPHVRDLRLTSFWLTHNRSDADDLARETFDKAYQLWHPALSPAKCRVLLFKVLTRLFFDGFQKKPLLLPANYIRSINVAVSQNRVAAARIVPVGGSDRTIIRLPVEIRFVRFLSRRGKFSPEEIVEIIGLMPSGMTLRPHRGFRLLQSGSFAYAGQG